ncbi:MULTISPECIES: hypothetical protein [Actinomyces]|uniref:Uncharacterized protein n=1 Tax=Actinomyces glycerinitolerans TaxID=1892869 RepID=A0A1M4RYS3_9ACTO|nr:MULTISPECIES: hypothetical protein [Actinomyces]RAX22493.1 hypothetical protein DRB07_08150 [Actinomyces sp. Z3]SHE25134.1 Hypothetical protein ACGLYG10_1348 [Actinomyces glycerinitolerans]
MFNSALSRQQDLELRYRSAVVRDLLATGVRVARSGGLSEVNRDSVTTTLAVGLGRLYEIVLGLRNLNLYGRWAPQPGDTGSTYPETRLDLLSMHDAVFDFLSLAPHGLTRAAGRGLSRINTDPAVPRLVSALGAYWEPTQGGRASSQSTTGAWNGIEDAVRQTPEEHAPDLLGGPNGEPAEYLAWRRAARASRDSEQSSASEQLADAVEAIWFTLGACGRDGALGHPGEIFAAEVLPDRTVSAAA